MCLVYSVHRVNRNCFYFHEIFSVFSHQAASDPLLPHSKKCHSASVISRILLLPAIYYTIMQAHERGTEIYIGNLMHKNYNNFALENWSQFISAHIKRYGIIIFSASSYSSITFAVSLQMNRLHVACNFCLNFQKKKTETKNKQNIIIKYSSHSYINAI